MHIGDYYLHKVDQSILASHADVDSQPISAAFCAAVTTLLALVGLMRLWIPFLLLVLVHGIPGLRPRKGGGGCHDQGVVGGRALLHGQAVGLVMGFDHHKDQFAEIVLCQQVTEQRHRALVGDHVAAQVDPSETSHRRHIDQRILHGWIAEVVALLQQVDPQHEC